MKTFLYLTWRVFAATLTTFVIVMFVTGLGGAFGKHFGMEGNRNVAEVIFAFGAGAMFTLIYRDRIDDRNERKKHGR